MPVTKLVALGLLLLLCFSVVICNALDNRCWTLGDFNSPVLEQDGDIVIGGLFPMHYIALETDHNYSERPQHQECSGRFDFRAFRWVQTMVFAIEEINSNSSLLPGVTLGYRILDSCDHVHTSLRSMLFLVNGTSSQTQANADGSAKCLSSAPISYFATCTCLTDKKEYPSFLRTVPSDVFQVQGLVQLVSHFGWRWVGTVGTDDDYSHYGIQAFTEQLEKLGGCIAFHHTIPKAPSQAQIHAILNSLEGSTAQVIIAFATEGQLLELLVEAAHRNLTRMQWVASEAWVTAKLLTIPELHPVLDGTVGFAFRGTTIPGLAEFLLRVRPSPKPESVFTNMFWEELFGCRLGYKDGGDSELSSLCTGSEDLMETENSYTDVSRVRISYNVYKAVYAIAHALHQLLQCGSKEHGSDHICKTESKFSPWQVIFMWEISNISDSNDCLTCSKETWPNQAQDQCIPKTLEFLSFQEPLGIILWAFSAFGACATFTVSAVFIRYRKTPVIRGNNIELSFLLLLFLCACFLISLTFIGKPSDWLCQIRYPAFGISFTLCISCILAKTVVVLMAFRATLPGSNVMKWFDPAKQRSSVILCTFVQALICIIWLTTKPPFASYNTKFMSAAIIVECTVGSEVGFWCVLGYIGLLACLCFLMAFLARKLPDNFNEAKFITFSMLIFFAVWITFIPVYVSSRGKYMVAVHVFAILASAFGLLLCIFAPKCYIVLLKPEKNDKKHMMKK
uniref:G-protein coupled receptors family 3 profile domain-containing protein n=1 Tax=Cyprinus carpio TaxID=7962 RepID=A0A8C2CAI6_CYPCA